MALTVTRLPRRKPETAQIRPELRAKLRAAVLKAFSEQDFHNVDMRSIAAECEMSFATIYKYFGDKERLLFAFASEWLGDLRLRLEEGMAGLESPREKLRKCLWIHLRYFEENPDIGRVLFMAIPLQRWMRDVTFVQSEFFRPMLQLVKQAQADGIIDDGVQAFQVIDFFVGAMQRSIIMWEYRKRSYGLTEQFDRLFKMFWCGISRPE